MIDVWYRLSKHEFCGKLKKENNVVKPIVCNGTYHMHELSFIRKKRKHVYISNTILECMITCFVALRANLTSLCFSNHLINYLVIICEQINIKYSFDLRIAIWIKTNVISIFLLYIHRTTCNRMFLFSLWKPSWHAKDRFTGFRWRVGS